MKIKIPCPTEDEEQIALMKWAAVMSGRYPELRLMYHIPNGGARSKPEAARFKAMGVKKGVPDICIGVQFDMGGKYADLSEAAEPPSYMEEDEDLDSALIEQEQDAQTLDLWEDETDIEKEMERDFL